MQVSFTKNLFLILLGFVAVNLGAQNLNTLTINEPAGIAGDYPMARAGFGSQANDPITANTSFADDGSIEGPNGASTGGTITDGCQTPYVNSIDGTIAFIDRGVCQFGQKALNAENEGAIAVIICNNVANATQGLFAMVPGDVGNQVTIPVFNMTYTDCQTIRQAIIDGEGNATLRFTCTVDGEYPDDAVWGTEPNQGDFNGGLGDWLVSTENTWEWNPDGNISKGAYGGVQMNSLSECNGVMEFNSDWLDNEGVQGNFGAGLCPSVCTGELISPTIDLSNEVIEGIVIEFNQALRQFQSQYFIIVSKDGGNTWPDTVQINTTYPVNSAAVGDERLSVALQGYAGATSIRFKFRYVGNYYYWGIDDVVVRNASFTDIQVNANFYAAAPSLRTPVSQLSPMPFLADVSNSGNRDATDVLLEAFILDSNDELLASFENPYGDLNAGQTIENRLFLDTYSPDPVPGLYTGIYGISSAEEDLTEANAVDYLFEITENTFGNLLPEDQVTPANYLGYSLDPWTVGDEVTYYSAGNVFYIADGNDITIDKVRCGLNNALADISETGFLNADIYEWVDEDANNECAPFERTRIGTGFVLISEADIPNSRNIEIPVWALNSEGGPDEGVEVNLSSNTNVIVMVHTAPLDPSVPRYELLGYTGRTLSSFDRSSNYSAVSLALDSLGTGRQAGSLFALDGASEFDVEDRNFEVVANGNLRTTAFVELDIKESVSTYDVNSTASVKTFPNPASKELLIDITLENMSKEVFVEMIAIDGRSVLNKTFTNVQDDRLRLMLDAVAAGTYSVLIHTDNGIISRKVSVVK